MNNTHNARIKRDLAARVGGYENLAKTIFSQPDGYNGHIVDLFAVAVDVSLTSVKCHVAEERRHYQTRWVYREDFEEATQ